MILSILFNSFTQQVGGQEEICRQKEHNSSLINRGETCINTEYWTDLGGTLAEK